MKRERIDKKRAIENYLRHYNSYKVGIANIQQQLDWILPSVTAVYSADAGSSGTFNIKSKVEDTVLDRLESRQALDLKEDMEMYKLIVNSIDRAISRLEKNERTFVEERYFKLKPMIQVAAVMGYHEKHVHRIRNIVIDKLMIGLSNILKLD